MCDAASRLISTGVQSLLDPFRIAFRQPAFLHQAINRLREQAHISTAAFVKLRDPGGCEWHLVSHLTAGSRTGTADEIRGIRDVDERSAHTTHTMPKLIGGETDLRSSRTDQLHTLRLWCGNTLLHPLIEIVQC